MQLDSFFIIWSHSPSIMQYLWKIELFLSLRLNELSCKHHICFRFVLFSSGNINKYPQICISIQCIMLYWLSWHCHILHYKTNHTCTFHYRYQPKCYCLVHAYMSQSCSMYVAFYVHNDRQGLIAIDPKEKRACNSSTVLVSFPDPTRAGIGGRGGNETKS